MITYQVVEESEDSFVAEIVEDDRVPLTIRFTTRAEAQAYLDEQKRSDFFIKMAGGPPPKYWFD